MAKSNSAFQTIRTEGALFPPDILQRIASLKVDGTRVDAYHLPPGFKVKEAITASWTALRAHWTNFQEASANLDDDDTGTAITNDRWLLPLFKELDYGRLTTDKAPVIDEKTYPIERFYNNTPIHLIGCNLQLDRRTKGARGAATASPHSMMQEFLNRSDDHLWAFISNGTHLRILRDNISLSRQAFVEFDLEAMMEGEVYSDFALLWLLCHQSRVESDQPEQCWLEKWSQLAREQGTRILKDLRGGVEKSIEALGQGFISHPRNDQLREKLQSGDLTKDDYYRQLLRIVYRLLFLFVAEDRELLHPSEVNSSTAELYDTYYSTRRLREMSQRIRGSKHADLWHSLSLVFDSLGKDDGCPQLGLIGLGSFLWRSESTVDLNGPAAICHGALAHGSPTENAEPTDPVYISNDDLLLSIRALAYVEQDRVLRSVDYRNLGSEELGSVYESLLELHPQMHVEAKTFSLNTAAGNERKTTGSYYTPDSLVQCLLDSALEPVVEQRLKDAKTISRRTLVPGSLPDDLPDWFDRIPADRRDVITSGNYTQIAEQAILALTVCDPACGSGHFLIAAAHRLARHLARVRTGESEPSPEDHQHALRDIIGRCIYGVDINPMAVELCKVSLWMEAIEPGKPLSFVDHHIQCGNSLLGTTPRLLADGIPDNAFKPIEGDVKTIVDNLKSDNRRQRRERADPSGTQMLALESEDLAATLGVEWEPFARISTSSDESLTSIAEKERLYARLVSGADYLNARLLADTWCAVFVWKKDESDLGRLCPTENDFRRIENNPHSILPHVRSEVRRLADQYQFFHWHLAFPDVFVLPGDVGKAENEQTGWSRGFDVVLGNPPWDKMTPDSKEFFSQYDEEVRFANKASERVLVDELLEDQTIASAWHEHRRKRFSEVALIRNSGFFQLFAEGNLGKGDQNTYRFFLELALFTTSRIGAAAQIVPEGLYNGTNAAAIRTSLFEKHNLVRLLGFENAREVWFDGIDSRMKFCLYATNGTGVAKSFSAAFNIRSTQELSAALSGSSLVIPTALVREFSPDALTLLEFRRQLDIDIARKLYDAHPKLGDKSAGEPTHSQSREIDLTNDAAILRDGGDGLPVYEGRMVNHYDHRAKGYVSGRARKAVWEEYDFGESSKRICPQWRIERDDIPTKNTDRIDRYRVGFSRIASPTNRRSFVAALIPPNSVASYTVQTVMYSPEFEWMYIPWLAVANSFSMDFIVRMRVSLDLNFTILNSLPFPRMIDPNEIVQELAPLVLALTCTSPEMEGYRDSMLAHGLDSPIELRDRDSSASRLPISCLVDAIVARKLFDLTLGELEYVMTRFPIIEKLDVEKYGRFLTRDLICLAHSQLDSNETTEVLSRLVDQMEEVA